MGIFFDSTVLEVKVRLDGQVIHERLDPPVDVRYLDNYIAKKWGPDAKLCSYMTMASDTYDGPASKPWQFWRQMEVEDC